MTTITAAELAHRVGKARAFARVAPRARCSRSMAAMFVDRDEVAA